MDWLSRNWFFLLFFGLFVLMHLGHGGHGGHGGHRPRRPEGDGEADSPRDRESNDGTSVHRH